MFESINKGNFNFIDHQGWNNSEDHDLNSVTHHQRFNKLIKASERQKRTAKRKQAASQTPKMSKKAQLQSRETNFNSFGLPHLLPENQVRVPIRTIDFQESHKKKPKWALRSTISARFQKTDRRQLSKSSELGKVNPQKRYSEERKQRIELGTKRLYFQFKNSGEVDRMTQRYIQDFLNEKGRVTLRQGRKMFEIPTPDKNFYT